MSKAKEMQLQIFEAAIRAQKITHTDLRIYMADQQQPISQIQSDDDAIEAIKNVIRRILVSYGINPSQAFSDEGFKKMYLGEVLRMVRIYHPSLSAQGFELAIELNIIDHWAKKVELYGSNISVNFLMEVLKVYKNHKGKSVAACEKIMEASQQEKPASADPDELRDMLYAEASQILSGSGQLSLPTIYYRYLVDTGELQETDENLDRWMQAGKQLAASLKSVAEKKANAPLDLKQLGTARQMLRSTSAKDLAMESAVMEWVHNIYSKMIPA